MSERWSPPNFRRLGSNRSSFFREFSPESDDMFFSDLPSSWNFPSRNSNFGSRMDDSVFNSFPRRSTMRGFPSHFDSSSSRDPFESGWQHQPSWVKDELRRSRGSSPSDSMQPPTPPGNNSRSGSSSPGINHQPFFSRQNSIPIRVVHENSRQNSRASTPASGTSDCSRSKSNSEMQEETNSVSSPEPGVEKHPGISAKTNTKQPYTAKRQPKVHHIPIYVEPRDEPSSFQSPPPTFANNCFIPKEVPHEKTQHTLSPEENRSSTRSSPFSSPRVQRKSETQNSCPDRATPSDGPERIIPVKVESKSTAGSPKQSKSDVKQEIPVQNNQPPPAASSCRPSAKPTPTDIIKLTLDAAEELRPKIESFRGQRGDKEYLFLDEMLTRNLIKLDLIETDGNPELRQNRRSAILKINELIHSLENKVKSSEIESSKEETKKVDADNVEQTMEKPCEVETAPDETAAPSSESKENSEIMDVDQVPQAESSNLEQNEESENSHVTSETTDIGKRDTVVENASRTTIELQPSADDAPADAKQAIPEPSNDDKQITDSNSERQPVPDNQKGEQCPKEHDITADTGCDQCMVSVNDDDKLGIEPKKFKSIINVQVTDNSDLPLPPHGTVDLAAT